MLFNSYEFLLGFLPVVLLGFFVIGKRSQRLAAGWLALASLFFYGWWSPKALPLLLASIGINFVLGNAVAPGPNEATEATGRRKRRLVAGIALNLGTLALFKYADFFVGNANTALASLGRATWDLPHLMLPIGISFYTFTQIAFLVDAWSGKVQERNPVHYLLFVTYFPHLIAGPVLHHAQMMPQFAAPATYRLQWDHLAAGASLFTLGLAKKLLIADPLSQYADIVFNQAHAGGQLQFFAAWFGAVGYALQIYFDFSGYSDMAVGLSMLFGIRLPINFNSPYQAANIIDFWRRWHISLSTFLRDYLYVPLGGSRRGSGRRYVNLLTTMLLGGFWHGANWTFIAWGALHGGYLVINHGWQHWRGEESRWPSRWSRLWTQALTLLAVCVAWVVFRAHSLAEAWAIYRGMLGLNGISLPAWWANRVEPAGGAVRFKGIWQGLLPSEAPQADFYAIAAFSLALALLAPNACAIFAPYARPTANHVDSPRLQLKQALVLGVLLGYCMHSMNKVSPFLYFQF
jgi:alginate O-acetyltransferase complex protein AlgI